MLGLSSPMSGTKGVPRADRTEQILAVAIDEFAERGYSGASMVTIATAAGISKPLIYQYFGSKDGLRKTCDDYIAGQAAVGNRATDCQCRIGCYAEYRVASHRNRRTDRHVCRCFQCCGNSSRAD